MKTPRLADLRRIVVKVGSSLIVDSEAGGPHGGGRRSAARVATGTTAYLRVLWSDVAGRKAARPADGGEAGLLRLVPRITAEIEAMAGLAGSGLSRGGMRTKIEAGKIATHAGTHMVIASGRVDNPLAAIAHGRCTLFLTPANPVTARKELIARSLQAHGT